MSKAYLLDTNIIVHLIRGSAVGKSIDAEFGLRSTMTQSVISVVTVGEMYALARWWSWGPGKQALIDKLLSQVVWVDINHPDILNAYGELYDLSLRAGRPMGENDLWIAATARVSGATLLTADRDFDHLHPANITRILIDPEKGHSVS